MTRVALALAVVALVAGCASEVTPTLAPKADDTLCFDPDSGTWADCVARRPVTVSTLLEPLPTPWVSWATVPLDYAEFDVMEDCRYPERAYTLLHSKGSGNWYGPVCLMPTPTP